MKSTICSPFDTSLANAASLIAFGPSAPLKAGISVRMLVRLRYSQVDNTWNELIATLTGPTLTSGSITLVHATNGGGSSGQAGQQNAAQFTDLTNVQLAPNFNGDAGDVQYEGIFTPSADGPLQLQGGFGNCLSPLGPAPIFEASVSVEPFTIPT